MSEGRFNDNDTDFLFYSQAEVELVEFLAVGPPCHGSKVYFIKQDKGERSAVHLDGDKLPLRVNQDLVIMSVAHYQDVLDDNSKWKKKYENLKRKFNQDGRSRAEGPGGRGQPRTKKMRMEVSKPPEPSQINDRDRLKKLFTLEDGAVALSDADKRNKVRIALSLSESVADWFSTKFWSTYVNSKFVSMAIANF